MRKRGQRRGEKTVTVKREEGETGRFLRSGYRAQDLWVTTWGFVARNNKNASRERIPGEGRLTTEDSCVRCPWASREFREPAARFMRCSVRLRGGVLKKRNAGEDSGRRKMENGDSEALKPVPYEGLGMLPRNLWVS